MCLLTLLLRLTVAFSVAATLPAAAQYKVVAPDGSVTYTDRPVTPPTGGQVQSMRAGTAAPAAAAGSTATLPLELRNAASRFPVTLFTSNDCQPCDTGRQLLQQRGIPYAERLVNTDDDTAALQRLTGGRTVPSLTVGGQALRGFQDGDWQSTLDLAGYPKESKLPRGWSAGAPTPLVVRSVVPREAPAQAPRADAPAPATPSGEGGVRF